MAPLHRNPPLGPTSCQLKHRLSPQVSPLTFAGNLARRDSREDFPMLSCCQKKGVKVNGVKPVFLTQEYCILRQKKWVGTVGSVFAGMRGHQSLNLRARFARFSQR